MDKISNLKVCSDTQTKQQKPDVGIPSYLKTFYWWAYLHPNAIRIFERQWLVNCILWGNYRKLRDSALEEIGTHFQGRILQLACVYGDLSEKIAARLSLQGRFDLLDVSPEQLENANRKLGKRHNLFLLHQDATSVDLPDRSYDVTLLFFLLHEQPEQQQRKTLAEALRLTRKGGRIVIVDYHLAGAWNPLRYLMFAVFKLLEPFASRFVSRRISDLLPRQFAGNIKQQTFFGGLYQKVIVEC